MKVARLAKTSRGRGTSRSTVQIERASDASDSGARGESADGGCKWLRSQDEFVIITEGHCHCHDYWSPL